MRHENLQGVLAPLLTPFNDDLSIATDLYVAHAHELLEDGCAGLVPFGTTGEATSVGVEERIAAVSALVDAGIDPGKLIPGTGLSDLTDTGRLSDACIRMGCNGVLVLPPYYFKAVSDDGLYDYFARLVGSLGAEARIILYHIPPIAVVGISPTLAERLYAEFPNNVIGIKDSSGDWQNTRQLLEIDGLAVYPGSELPLLEALDLGAPGCITATANTNAAAIAAVINGYVSGDHDAAQAAHEPVRRFRETLQQHAPIPAQKRLLAIRSGDRRWATVRPPLTRMVEAEGASLLAELEEISGTEIGP